MGPLSLIVGVCLASPAAAQRVEKVELNLQPPGAQWRGPAPQLLPQTLTLAPASLLTVPTLNVTPGLAFAPLAPVRPVIQAAPVVAITPKVLGSAPVSDPAVNALKSFDAPASEKKDAVETSDGDIEAGRQRFDNGAEKARDDIPYPPRAGETVRVAGADYVLGPQYPSGENAFVFTVKDRPELVIKILKRGVPRSESDELPGLELLSKTDLAHSKLLAASASGSALVKERVEGETAADILARGGSLSPTQRQGLAEFFVAMVRGGHVADLNAGNLVWNASASRWVLVDAGMFKKGPAALALAQLYYRNQPGDYLGADHAAFLVAVRAGLGEESAEWKDILAKPGKYAPALRKGLKSLPEAEKLPELLPEHPAPGARVVIAGVAYILGAQIGVGQGSNGAVFRVKGRDGLIMKFPIAGSKANVKEGANLRLLDATKIAHTTLVAASEDGSVLVKTFARGETGQTILARGPLSAEQFEALVEFAASLVRAGISPDVKPANLVWDAPLARWILIDGGNLGPAGSEEIIEWMLHPSQLPGHADIDRAGFLKRLRARLATKN